jgi:hypothetical protein
MTSQEKNKLKEFLINRDIDRALAFLEAVEVHEGNYTDSQRNAAWLYMTMKAKQLNEAGLEMRKVLKPTYELPWTKDSFHDHIFIPIQKAMFGTTSMRSLKKLQVSKVYDVIERELAEKFGVDIIEFPSDEKRQMANLGGYKTRAGQGTEGVDYPEWNGKSSL